MANKKKSGAVNAPYNFNQHISVFYEMKHGKDEITIGTPLRFKYERGTFKFIKMVHNDEKKVTWIDCLSTDGRYRSFYVSQLRGVARSKKKRNKKVA